MQVSAQVYEARNVLYSAISDVSRGMSRGRRRLDHVPEAM